MENSPIDITKYLGKPYIDNCRDGTGFDCYTLFLAIQKDFGHEFIDYKYDSKNIQMRQFGIEQQKKLYPFEKIETPVIGCAVVMYYNDIPQHIGVYLGHNLVIHCCENRGVVVDETRCLKIEGFYRLKK